MSLRLLNNISGHVSSVCFTLFVLGSSFFELLDSFTSKMARLYTQ